MGLSLNSERQPTLLGVGAKLREDPPCGLEFHEEDGLVGVCLHSGGDPALCCLSGYFPVLALATRTSSIPSSLF